MDNFGIHRLCKFVMRTVSRETVAKCLGRPRKPQSPASGPKTVCGKIGCGKIMQTINGWPPAGWMILSGYMPAKFPEGATASEGATDHWQRAVCPKHAAELIDPTQLAKIDDIMQQIKTEATGFNMLDIPSAR